MYIYLSIYVSTYLYLSICINMDVQIPNHGLASIVHVAESAEDLIKRGGG